MSNTSAHIIDPVLHNLEESFQNSLERLFHLIRIESISTDPAYKKQCASCAHEIAQDLSSIGFKTNIHQTSGHPIVVGEHAGCMLDAPSVLFYGHYDVQPVDPLDLWETDPFSPEIKQRKKKDVIVGRGAADDKGQIMTFIEACRAWKKVHGSLPCKITIVLEGEEECGSPSFKDFLIQNATTLKSDLALVCDTSMCNEDTPEICLGLRGLLSEEIIITAANQDLHSGEFGGVAINPIHVLTRILSEISDRNHRIQLPGFYDSIEPMSLSLKEEWKKKNINALLLTDMQNAGIYVDPKKQETITENLWCLPCFDVNGITGGYTGKGFKSIIPAHASAKISFRLVKNQNPTSIRKTLHTFVQERIPEGCRVEFLPYGESSGVEFSPNSIFFKAAQKALFEEWSTSPLLGASGASIPVLSDLSTILDLDVMLIGFGLKNDLIHSPNEKYDLQSFRKGQRSWVRILNGLAKCNKHDKKTFSS